MKESHLKTNDFSKRRIKANITGYLFCLPGLLLLLIVGIYSIVFSMIISFYNWGGIDFFGTARFVGWDNFRNILLGMFGSDVLGASNFYSALFHNVEIAILCIVFIIPIALSLAFLIQNAGRLTKIFRTIYFMPMVASGVAVFYVWQNLFKPDGVLNAIFKVLGLNFLVMYNGWLGSPDTALFGVIITMIWGGIPGIMILYYAGLTNIDKSLYEAAEIDGASKFKTLVKITWPLIKPITVIAVIMLLNGSFQTFDSVYVLTGGGPAGSTEVIGTLIYKSAFGMGSQFGAPCAMGWSVFLITAALSVFSIKGFKTDY